LIPDGNSGGLSPGSGKSGSDPDFPRRARDIAARVFGYAAALAVAAMMLLTVADVMLRGVFNRPIHGTYELVELLLACAVFLALPAAFLRDEHIVVDMVDHYAPRAVPALKRLAGIIAVVVLVVLGWQAVLAARDTLAFGDVTMDLALPRILYWLPLLAGVACAALAAVVMLLRRDR
jgi:TRAP-type C4-dicarboxylate transport system permease small subunit